MSITEQQNQALAAFVACVVAKLNPSMTAHTFPRNGGAEYEWKHGRLCIVWPGRTPDGPDPEGEHEQQVSQGRRAPRKKA